MENVHETPAEESAKTEGKRLETAKAVRASREKLSAFVKSGVEVFSGAGESVEGAIRNALRARHNVIMVRVNDESLARLTDLVDAGLFKSRSESAAFMISEGIKRQAPLFDKIAEKISEIQRIRAELQSMAKPSEAE